MRKIKLGCILAGVITVAGCTVQAPYDPQVYGMPQSQFQKLSPQQQQQVIQFHNQMIQSQTKSASQVANLSTNNVSTISKTTDVGGKKKTVTTTINTPSQGNPDLVTVAPQQAPIPVVVNND